MAMADAVVQAFLLSLQEANDCFPGPIVSFVSNPVLTDWSGFPKFQFDHDTSHGREGNENSSRCFQLSHSPLLLQHSASRAFFGEGPFVFVLISNTF